MLFQCYGNCFHINESCLLCGLIKYNHSNVVKNDMQRVMVVIKDRLGI